MKRLTLYILPLFLLLSCVSSAQVINRIKADTTKLQGTSGSGNTLQIFNNTRSVKGFLYNIGNGVTEFRPGAVRLPGNQVRIGNDTIDIGQGGSGDGTNFGNANLRLNADRTHSAAGHSITIDSSSSFNVVTDTFKITSRKGYSILSAVISGPGLSTSDANYIFWYNNSSTVVASNGLDQFDIVDDNSYSNHIYTVVENTTLVTDYRRRPIVAVDTIKYLIKDPSTTGAYNLRFQFLQKELNAVLVLHDNYTSTLTPLNYTLTGFIDVPFNITSDPATRGNRFYITLTPLSPWANLDIQLDSARGFVPTEGVVVGPNRSFKRYPLSNFSSKWSQNSVGIDYSLGRVGFGTSTPIQKIDVLGHINVAADSSYRIGNFNAIRARVFDDSYFFGNSGGGGTTGTGNQNTGVGSTSLFSITSAVHATAIGKGALFSLTSGIGNVGIGSFALGSIATTSYNVGLGLSAGDDYNNSSAKNISGTRSIFIGANTRAFADAQTNQIVIGDTTYGHGSNSITFGNNNITKTWLKGTINLRGYGTGTHTGTATYTLSSDMNGNIIETPVGGPGVGSSANADSLAHVAANQYSLKYTTLGGYGINDAYPLTGNPSSFLVAGDITGKANLASPTFSGTVSLPSTTSIGSVTNTEIGYLSGTTSNVQTQLNGKAASTAGLATGILKNTTGTGAHTIAVASDFPQLDQNTNGSAGSISGTNVITNANLATMPAFSIKGNTTAVATSPSNLTNTQVTGMLNLFSTAAKGLVPASTTFDQRVLHADGTWGWNVRDSAFIITGPEFLVKKGKPLNSGVPDTLTKIKTDSVARASLSLVKTPNLTSYDPVTGVLSIDTSSTTNSHASKVILVNNTKLTNTLNALENTVFTGTIPGGSIGVNGSFHISALWSTTNNGNAKTVRIKFNGTTVMTYSLTTLSVSVSTYTIIRNRNSLTAQVSGPNNAGGNATFNLSSGTAPSVTAFNTAANITVTVTIQDASDASALEAFEIIANF